MYSYLLLNLHVNNVSQVNHVPSWTIFLKEKMMLYTLQYHKNNFMMELPIVLYTVAHNTLIHCKNDIRSNVAHDRKIS